MICVSMYNMIDTVQYIFFLILGLAQQPVRSGPAESEATKCLRIFEPGCPHGDAQGEAHGEAMWDSYRICLRDL